MKIGRALAGSALIFVIAGPALGKPVVIRELNTAPLLGSSGSTAAQLSKLLQHEALVQEAAGKLGLTPDEFNAFMRQWRMHQIRWVEIPRHLDGMTWAAGNRVHVLKDVYIPANTMGWEVDVKGHDRTLSLFLPAACGNLSLVRRAKQIVHAPLPKPLPSAQPSTPPTPQETEAPPTPVPEATPEVAVAPAVVAAASHPLWPYLVPLILTTVHAGGGGYGEPPGGPPPGPPPGFLSTG